MTGFSTVTKIRSLGLFRKYIQKGRIKMKYDIFISYRRDGGDTLAQLIYDRLTDRGYRVFLDIESLRSGKFNEKLFDVIDECSDVVVILPPRAFERCRNEGDWLYLELSYAMKARKNIIPVMMKGFEWPAETPEGLEELQNFNGIQDSKDYFDAVIDKMTSLLLSRPALFGKVRKKIGKRKLRINIREKVRRRRRLLIGVSVILLAAVSAVFISRGYRRHQLEEMSKNVDIVLYPSDEMSASAYYDAQELLKHRLDLLAAGEDYEFTVENDMIHVLIPQKVFRGAAPEDILTSYVRCPTELSVIGYIDGSSHFRSIAENQRVDVERDDIAAMKRKTGSGEEIHIERIDKEFYGLEEAEEYQYLEITFSEDTVSKIRELYGEHEIYYLGQDVKGGESTFCYFQMLASESQNTFYIVDNYQEDNFYDLMEFNYQHEPFEGSFIANCILPTRWECLSETANPGENQCDIWDLEQPYITMNFFTGNNEIAAGELKDYMSNLKRRLDTLDVPYAIGNVVDPEYENGLMLRTETEHMGNEIAKMLFSSYGLKVQGMYYDLLNSYDIKGIEYEEKDDGTYQFSLVLSDNFENDWWTDDFNEAVKGISSSENQEIYLLTDYSYRIAKANINEAVNGTKVTFDNLYYLGIDTIGSEECYLLDLLKEIAEMPRMSAGGTSHTLADYRMDGADEKESENVSVSEKMTQNATEAICSVYPDAKITSYTDSLWVNMNIVPDEEFPEKVNEAIQEIYGICGLTSGEWEDVTISIGDGADGQILITIESDNDNHCMEYSGYYLGESIKSYSKEFEQIFQKDPFYTQTVRIKYEGAWLFDYE